MATTTGIELGPNSCLLTGVRSSRSGVAEIVALHRIDEAEWPIDHHELEGTLRSIRRKKHLPRQAAIVAWNDDANDDGRTGFMRDAIGSLESAGFRIASTLSPTQALAKLAASRRRTSPGEAVAWLALNTHAAAIAIVRDGDLLYSRTFPWNYKPDQPTGKAQLLQRYTLVAHLAPELAHGMTAVRDTHDLSVQTVVTCGNLPELRSLTMPLIEELDREVETLDSSEGLEVVRNGRTDRFSELAPALRLATAAAIAEPHALMARWSIPPIARVAAAAAVAATLAWAAYSYWSVPASRSGHPLPTSRTGGGQSARPSAAETTAATPTVESTRGRSASTIDSSARPVATQGNRQSTGPQRSSAEGVRPRPETMVGSVEMPRDAGRTSGAGRQHRSPAPGRPAGARVPTMVSPAAQQPPSTAAGHNRGTTTLPAPRAASREPAPLNEPLPKIDSVLIDQDRRLALIGGSVVSVGDSIGSRVVVQIDRDVVVMREPSGRTVRVRVRS
jgi:hypothetical protein